MNMSYVHQLSRLFKARLTTVQKENLRYHLKRRTPVLCGADAEKYTNGNGAG